MLQREKAQAPSACTEASPDMTMAMAEHSDLKPGSSPASESDQDRGRQPQPGSGTACGSEQGGTRQPGDAGCAAQDLAMMQPGAPEASEPDLAGMVHPPCSAAKFPIAKATGGSANSMMDGLTDEEDVPPVDVVPEVPEPPHLQHCEQDWCLDGTCVRDHAFLARHSGPALLCQAPATKYCRNLPRNKTL